MGFEGGDYIKGQSTEYTFIFFYVVLLGFLTFMASVGAPIFTVPGVAEPPSPPDAWYKWPGYLLSTVGYMFKLLLIPEVPTELKVLTTIIFLPFVILMVWIILKWIAPVIADMIPF